VYAACEDFGIALVEAQACGTPVIAYGAGGARETVRDIRESPDTGTGLLFEEQSELALVEAVKTFEEQSGNFNPEMALEQAVKFGPTIFEKRYLAFVDRSYRRFKSRDRS